MFLENSFDLWQKYTKNTKVFQWGLIQFQEVRIFLEWGDILILPCIENRIDSLRLTGEGEAIVEKLENSYKYL